MVDLVTRRPVTGAGPARPPASASPTDGWPALMAVALEWNVLDWMNPVLTSLYVRVLVEDRFNRNGKDRSIWRDDAMVLSSAVPEPCQLVDIADIAQTMPYGIAIGDL